MKKKNNKNLIISSKALFFKSVFIYFKNISKWNLLHFFAICIYFISIIFEDIIKKPALPKSVLSNKKFLYLLDTNKFYNYLVYLYNIILYYNKYNKYLFNFTLFKYIILSVLHKFCVLDDYLFNFIAETVVSWFYVGVSSWLMYKYFLKPQWNKHFKFHWDLYQEKRAARSTEQYYKTSKYKSNKYKFSKNYMLDHKRYYDKDPFNSKFHYKLFKLDKTKWFITYNIKQRKFINYYINNYLIELNQNINDMNIKNFENFIQSQNLEKYQDYILESYKTEFNAQLLYNFYIKSILDTPFMDDNIPFTLFKFKQNKIDKKKLNQLSYLISYAYIYEKKKKNLLSDLSRKKLQDSFFSFYKWKLKEVSVLTVRYFDNMLVPINPLDTYKDNLNKIFKDIDSYTITDLQKIIQLSFDDLAKAEEMLCVDVDNDEAFISYDATDYAKSKNILSLFIYVNKTNLHNIQLNNFVNQVKSQYPNLSNCLINLDLFDENFTSDTQLLELFSNENFFYLDYMSLSINANKYTLCYLLFVFKVLKIVKEYNIYHENNSLQFLQHYNSTIFDYHKYINKNFKYITKSLNSFEQFRFDLAVIDFTYKDPIGPLYFQNKKNTASYFAYLNKQNNLNILLEKNVLSKNYNYKKFLHYFSKYKNLEELNKFEKINLAEVSDLKSFDSYVYPHIELEDLVANLKLQEKQIKMWLHHYNYNENGVLENFADLQFYFFDLPGNEIFQQDIFYFFDYRDSSVLKFEVDDYNLREKIEFQINYSTLFFNYFIKCCKSRKTFFFNPFIETLLFDDKEFYYKNLDIYMDKDKTDILNFLTQFLKGFKSVIFNNRLNVIKHIESEIYLYTRFIEKIQNFNFELLYNPDILKILNTKELYNLEFDLYAIMMILEHKIGRLDTLRTTVNKYINLLHYNKLELFFDHPMLNLNKGFLLLKEAYFNCLEELITEDRLFDHLFNLTMCMFRVFDRHNQHLRRDILLKNGIIPKVINLNEEDWIYIFTNIEIKNSLIFIELYNSKAFFLNNVPWRPSLTFNDIIHNLSSFSERTIANPNSNDFINWEQFFLIYSKRKTVINTLNGNDIKNLFLYFDLYNKNTYDYIENDELFNTFLINNNLTFSEIENKCYIKSKKKKKKNFNYDNLTIKSNSVDIIKDTFDDLNDIEIDVKDYTKNIKFDETLTLTQNLNLYDFILFDKLLDKSDDTIEISKFFLLDIKKKINYFKDSKFKYLLLLYNEMLENDYQEALNIYTLKIPFNHFFYLFKSFANIVALNELNVNVLTLRKIVENCFEPHIDYFKLSKFSYIANFVKDNKDLYSLNWMNKMSKIFNNTNIYIENELLPFILNIYNSFNIKNINNETFLGNLNDFVDTSCFKGLDQLKNLYTFKEDVAYEALIVIYKFLDMHILKSIVMLNQLINYKNLLHNNYLNFCELNKNNLNVINQLLVKYQKDLKNENYLALINLLLYVKDPIYLYNILNVNLKLYLEYILKIFNIIKNPEFNKLNYNFILGAVFYNAKYKTYNEVDLNALNKIKFSKFFSINKLKELNLLITALDYSINYFDLSLFDIVNLKKEVVLQSIDNLNPLNIIKNFNFNLLIKDFNFLLVVNNKSLIKFYNTSEILLLKDFQIFQNNNNNFENLKNESDILIHLNALIKYNKNIYLHKLKNNLLNKTKKMLSAPLILFNKNLKVVKSDTESSESITNTYSYKSVSSSSVSEEEEEEIIVTNTNDNNVDKKVKDKSDESESDISTDDNKNSLIQSMQDKRFLIANIFTEFRQWASDKEFIRAFQECKKNFDIILFDYEHEIWDELRPKFKTHKHFLYFVNTISKDNKEAMFHSLWNLTISKIQKQREDLKLKKKKKRWFNLLNKSTLKSSESNEWKNSDNEFVNEFEVTLEDKKMVCEWNEKFWFLNICDTGYKHKKSSKIAYEVWKGALNGNPFLEEKNEFNKEIESNSWDSDWWKKF